jgi:hypothetical protein
MFYFHITFGFLSIKCHPWQMQQAQILIQTSVAPLKMVGLRILIVLSARFENLNQVCKGASYVFP